MAMMTMSRFVLVMLLLSGAHGLQKTSMGARMEGVQIQGQGVVRRDHVSQDTAPRPVPDVSRECSALAQREFVYQDTQCGRIGVTLKDLNHVFDVEQEYWAEQGTIDPWWAVDTQLPHGGRPPMSLKMRFYRSGVDTATVMQRTLKQPRAFGINWTAKGTALDLGCGLGRMSHALAYLGFNRVLCVDQAQTFLDGAKQGLLDVSSQPSGPANVVSTFTAKKVEYLRSGPSLLCTVQPKSVDFVHSILTLQHMKPMLQVAYIEQLCDALKIGGTGYFQIPIIVYGQGPDAHCDVHSERRAMMMHYTPEAEVRNHLEARGCRVVLSEEKDQIGNVGRSNHFIFVKEDRLK